STPEPDPDGRSPSGSAGNRSRCAGPPAGPGRRGRYGPGREPVGASATDPAGTRSTPPSVAAPRGWRRAERLRRPVRGTEGLVGYRSFLLPSLLSEHCVQDDTPERFET